MSNGAGEDSKPESAGTEGFAESDFQLEALPDNLSAQEAKLLKAEIHSLHEEISRLQGALFALRSSTAFKLRERILPQGSFLQRLYLSLRTGNGVGSNTLKAIEYDKWCKRWDSLTNVDRAGIEAQVESMREPPLISIAMPVYNPSIELFEAAIRSVRDQLYPNWELCIADDSTTDPSIRPILERWANEDKRIKVRFRSEHGRISVAINDAVSLATGGYIGFLDHHDLLAQHALFTVAKYIERFPESKLFYSDEDVVDENGVRSLPQFKPGWDPLLLLAMNYVSHLTVFESRHGESIGWLRDGFEGAEDWDFILRFTEGLIGSHVVHIPHVLYHRRTHAPPIAGDVQRRACDIENQTKAVQEALVRQGEFAYAAQSSRWGVMRVSFLVREPIPRVSVIIPTRDKSEILSKCLNSLFELTQYAVYEVVILDNGSSDLQSLKYLAALEEKGKAKVVRVDSPFNYSALNNRGVRESSGQIVALLNNDVEIVEPQWMEQLSAHATRPGTGAVGARLLYPNGTVQHGGVLLGFQKLAAHLHLGLSGNSKGYMGRAVVDQHVSAVTGACLFVRRDYFEQVGGLDERLAVAFNDVDFCLRLKAIGLNNVYAGSVTCIHHESLSRGLDDTPEKMSRATFESLRLRSRWPEELREDPFYNPNLSLDLETFAIGTEPRVDFPWRAPIL